MCVCVQIDRNEESSQSPAAKYIETLKVALLSLMSVCFVTVK